jgi:Rrf2 family protein
MTKSTYRKPSLISKTAEYALRAVLYIARTATGEAVRAANLARALQVPSNYLSKILHTLARSGILLSERGRNGGFRLAVPSSDLSLAAVIEPFDELRRRGACLLGRPECSDGNPCGAHDRWKELHEQVSDFFQKTTVADLIEGTAPLATAPKAKGEAGE